MVLFYFKFYFKSLEDTSTLVVMFIQCMRKTRTHLMRTCQITRILSLTYSTANT